MAFRSNKPFTLQVSLSETLDRVVTALKQANPTMSDEALSEACGWKATTIQLFRDKRRYPGGSHLKNLESAIENGRVNGSASAIYDIRCILEHPIF